MNKPDRLSVIRALCQRHPTPRVGALSPSVHDAREEIRLAKMADDDESTLDEGVSLEVISPLMARAGGAETDGHARGGEYALTRAEREQAANDLWHYRHPKTLWLARVTA